ncbi:MAG TPA: NUDIX hydrolase [Opitutales bacterium]|nr:NUDIX hydrolase [Opitutales bacterium]
MQEGDNRPPALWETLSSRPLADARVFRVDVERARNPRSGQEGDFSIIRAPDWVVVLASVEPEVYLMVNQYRFGSHTLSWEFPAGCLERGESPLEGAARELAEETGYAPAAVGRIIGSFFPNPAIQDNTCHVVLFEAVTKVGEPRREAFEEMQMELLRIDQIRRMAQDGDIVHGMVHAALFFLGQG